MSKGLLETDSVIKQIRHTAMLVPPEPGHTAWRSVCMWWEADVEIPLKPKERPITNNLPVAVR